MKFVTDTNALLKKPEVVFDFDCVIPSHVLREVEQLELKRKSDNTLQFQIRRLKKFLDANEGNPHIYYDLRDYKFTLEKADENGFDAQYVDNILLQICVDNGYGLITDDRLLKEKCKLYNIPIQKMDESNFVDNKGFQEFEMSDTGYNRMMETPYFNHFDLIVNEYAIVNNVKDGELLDIVKWTGDVTKSLRDEQGKLGAEFRTNQFGKFKPLDEYQIMAVDSIFNNQLTSIRGRAGSGKSLIALNTAWRLVEEQGYKLVIFCNPTKTLDSAELGFYKGSRIDKLLQTVGTMLKSKFGDEIEILRQMEDGKLDILPFSDIRGYDTSGNKTICWFIESQNLTSNLMKLGLQRIGEETKVIVDGDYTTQVDKDAYASDNGMKRMSEVFRGNGLYGEIELQNIHRSALADIADLM